MEGPVWSAAVSLRDKIFVDALATFSSTEVARILGVVVPLVAPQAAGALALQDLKKELRALRESVDSIRNSSLETALDNITSALSALQEGEFEQVIVLHTLPSNFTLLLFKGVLTELLNILGKGTFQTSKR